MKLSLILPIILLSFYSYFWWLYNHNRHNFLLHHRGCMI